MIFDQYLQEGTWPSQVVGAGDVPIRSCCLKVEVLNPIKEDTEGRKVDANPNSMVLLVTYGHVKILLTADIDQEREALLVRKYGSRLNSLVMKASHHASGNSNSDEFLGAVNPEVAVVTVGTNDWGYPGLETVKRLRSHSSAVLRTDDVGSVVLQTDGRSLKLLKPEGL